MLWTTIPAHIHVHTISGHTRHAKTGGGQTWHAQLSASYKLCVSHSAEKGMHYVELESFRLLLNIDIFALAMLSVNPPSLLYTEAIFEDLVS